MSRKPTPSTSLPVAYHILKLWMRLVMRLVPDARRVQWHAEWDGELWYGVAADARPDGLNRFKAK